MMMDLCIISGCIFVAFFFFVGLFLGGRSGDGVGEEEGEMGQDSITHGMLELECFLVVEGRLFTRIKLLMKLAPKEERGKDIARSICEKLKVRDKDIWIERRKV